MTLTFQRTGLAIAIGLVAVYVWFAARNYQAARLASGLDIPSLQRAMTLAPRNAAYQDLLCRFLLFDRQEAAAAIPHCRRATALNPYYSAYWLDLALGYYSAGEQDLQRQAILEAIAVDPTTPDVAWSAANFFLLQHNLPEALRQFSIVIANDPGKVTPSLDLCWRAVPDVRTIEAILPRDPGVYLQFVRLLTANNEWEGAQRVWSDFLTLNREVDYRQALFYVDALLQHHDVAHAVQVWQQLMSRSEVLRKRGRADDLVVNGGFEQGILNGGFDWRYARQDGSTVSLDSSEFHSGTQSLSISYNGRNGDSGMLQYVPVKANSRYTLSAWVKSEGLKSGSGICVSASDAYTDKLYGQTQETLGTTGWHRVEADFQTGPETELVAMRFTHAHGSLWVEGQLWVDDVSLQATSNSPAAQE